MKRLIVLTLAVFFVVAGQGAYASQAGFSTDFSTDKNSKHSRDESVSKKKDLREQDSNGKRESTTTSTGTDHQDSKSNRQSSQEMRNASADVTLPLEIVFVDQIRQLESQGVEPFTSCKVISNPKLKRDFGLDARMQYGVIDSIKADYISKAAASNSDITDIIGEDGEQQVRQYRDCLAYYGAVIGQAYINLSSDLQEFKPKKDRSGATVVSSIGYEDFLVLAESALQRTLKEGLTNSTIKRTYQAITGDQTTPCRFDSVKMEGGIKCGPSMMVLATVPQLHVSPSIHWFGEGGAAGFKGEYKLSRGWSYTAAIENLTSDSKYSKFAKDVQEFAEHLRTEGKGKESVRVERRAKDLTDAQKAAVSPTSLIHMGE